MKGAELDARRHVAWGANVLFWSHLGCSGQNASIFSCDGFV